MEKCLTGLTIIIKIMIVKLKNIQLKKVPNIEFVFMEQMQTLEEMEVNNVQNITLKKEQLLNIN